MTATGSAPPAGEVERIHLRTADNQVFAIFRQLPDEIRVVLPMGEDRDRLLRTRLTGRGQRTWTERGQGVVALVQSRDEKSFTVRSPDGALRWRVRTSPRRIQVGDHPDGLPGFELRLSRNDLVSVLGDGETPLGEVAFNRGRTRIVIRDPRGALLFWSDSERFSMFYGALLAPDLEEIDRWVVMAELLHRQL